MHPEDALEVLLVEDDDDLRELLAARLRRSGCRVHEASSGAEALGRLRERVIDAVVADVGLPDMDGHALARAIRSDPRTAGVRLVALTGHCGDDAVARTRDAGFDAHFVKPVSLPVLLEALRSGTRAPR